MTKMLALSLMLGSACAADLLAQTRAPDHRLVPPTVTKNGSVAHAARIPNGSIHLDGQLGEAGWHQAIPITEFVQREPAAGLPASEPSEVRVLFTEDALYVGFRAFDSRPDDIRAVLTRRDGDSPSDWLVVAIDSYRDRRTAFVFAVNPAGVKLDFYLSDDIQRDDSWDAVWDAAVTRDPQGWTAEFRIPFSQLRFAEAEEQRWGFQLVRIIRRLGEEDHWQLMPRDEAGVVSRFGDLVGIAGVQPRRRAEALPYVALSAVRAPGAAADPFWSATAATVRAGADLALGVTPDMTLSATINPDFGQVEADPAVVNLTAFETFFPERRPFFLEGLDLFRFPISIGDGDEDNETLFYTRRIGRAPQGQADPRGGYAESVGQTTILGAAKLSGKTRRGWSIGLLGALTAREAAEVVDSTGQLHRDVLEPPAGYLVGRVGRDFRRGATQLSAFGTAVLRDLPDSLVSLRHSAYTAGVRWTHRFAGDRYAFLGWAAGSHVAGPAPAIAATQQSSARYFQRPDATHVDLDTTRTALAGLTAHAGLGKIAGTWRWTAGLDTRSPGFEVNDAGYQRNADRTQALLWLSRRWLRPGRVFRRVETEATVWNTWSYGWERTENMASADLWAELANFWEIWLGTEQAFEALDASALRGGPAIVQPHTGVAWAGFESDERRQLRAGMRGWVARQAESGSWGYEIRPQVAWRPAANAELSAAPSLTRRRNTWQYLTAATAGGSPHYLFGDLHQTTVALSFRANLTFTPTLSVQAWVQPFISSARYSQYRQVTDPRADHFSGRFQDLRGSRVEEDEGQIRIDLDGDGQSDVAGPPPDFTQVSLRSNVVLRWEYALGSTLFLVWQHGRGDREADGRFDLGRSLHTLWTLNGSNSLVLKVNYWIGR